MELKEAYQNLRVSDEERKSIQRYLGYKHTSINILGSLDPSSYARLRKAGWSLPQTEEEIKEGINDFVNVYAAMYKDSKDRKPYGNLIRGTSNKAVSSLYSRTDHFLSFSSREDIAKTFCEYGDSALVRVDIGDGVPFLEAEGYREENSKDEAEVIISPFCKIKSHEHQSTWNGYKYYKISLEKPELKEKSQEEIDNLLEKVVSGFADNIKNMEKYNQLNDKRQWLMEKYKRASDRRDREELKAISADEKKVSDELFELYKSTHEFEENLHDLLEGMCKQKELELDKSREVIDEERKRLEEEEKRKQEEEKVKQEALKKEQERQSAISDISFKKEATPVNSSRLENTINDAYDRLLISENTFKNLASRLGIALTRTIAGSGINQNIENIKENLKNVNSKAINTDIPENISLKDVSAISRELTPLVDGVAYSLELTKNFPDIINMYNQQTDKDIKRNLYLKVQGIIQDARIQKLTQEKQALTEQQVGFLGRLTGADKLKEEKIKNINLKIQAIKTEVPQEQQKYSTRDMLADIHACAISELSGNLTPDMKRMSNAIRANFVDKESGAFTDQYIQQLAMQKIEQKRNSNLPVVQNKKPRLFKTTKSKMQDLMQENQELQGRIAQNQMSGNRWASYEVQEGDALAIFENQLKGISSSTKEKQQEKTDLDKTAPLW